MMDRISLSKYFDRYSRKKPKKKSEFKNLLFRMSLIRETLHLNTYHTEQDNTVVE